MTDYSVPVRDPMVRLYVSKMEWLPNTYPLSCSGPMYMMSPKITMRIFDLFSSTLKEDYIWIEDIYLTGILRQKENVSLVDLGEQFITKHESDSSFIAAHLD